jgi:hypothetical protein
MRDSIFGMAQLTWMTRIEADDPRPMRGQRRRSASGTSTKQLLG